MRVAIRGACRPRQLFLLAVAAIAAVALIGGPFGRAARPAAADSAAVALANYAFGPATITVSPGDTVTWTNTDSDVHNVIAFDNSFASPALNQGDTFSFTFQTAGTYEYRCTIHPWMLANVVVGQAGASTGDSTSPDSTPVATPTGSEAPAAVTVARGGRYVSSITSITVSPAAS